MQLGDIICSFSEDWLGLMNVVERTDDPGTGCLVHMVNWSLKKDEALEPLSHAGCTYGDGGGCALPAQDRDIR